MKLPELSIRRPVFAWMLMAGLIVFGGICFVRMGVSQLPDVDFPVVSISVALDGAAPAVMETDVVDPIEDAVMSIQGVRSVSSTARNGAATITVEFDLSREIDPALQEVQTKVAQAQKLLPKNLDPPVITKTNPEDQPIIWLALQASDKHKIQELMIFVRDKLKGQFATVPGVGDVFLGGYVDPNLRVWVDEKGLNRFSLSVNDVINTIQNEHSEIPGGQVQTSKRESNVRTMGEATSPEDFGKIVINSRGNMPNYRPIYLNQVAHIEEGLADVRRISRAVGKTAVGLGIRKQRGANAVEVVRLVRKKMIEVNKHLPEGLEVAVNFDSTRFIEESVGELNFTLVLSALLTALVCWFFLGSWSSTLNVLLAIPTSIVGAFIVLYFCGFTLNTFTLLGLSLAIGIVVDDAIMVLENIIRHKEMGKSKEAAALDGAVEITFAAMAATVAVIAIFLPVIFMKGVIGKFFYQFGVTMTVAVLLSLIEALTLTPMRCAAFIETSGKSTRIGRAMDVFLDWCRHTYRSILVKALRHRWKVVLTTLAFFAASMVSVGKVGKEFVPAQDQSVFMIRIQTPVGSSLDYTDSKFREVEKYVMTRREVRRYFTAVGGFGGGEVNTGIVFVTMRPPGQRGVDPKLHRELTQGDLMGEMRASLNKIPDVKAFIQDLSMRGFTASRGFPVEFNVRGPNWDKLAGYAKQIMAEMEKTGMVSDIDSDYQEGMPEVQIIPDREAASLRGVSVAAIGQTVSALIGGVVVGRYPKDGHRFDIRVRVTSSTRPQADRIKDLYVRNNRGELVRLSDVVKVQERMTLQAVSRKERERAISIFANMKPGASQAVALEEVQKIAKRVLPDDYSVRLSGSAETMKESFQSLIFALVLGLIVAYMVLGSQFNSFIDPITVLIALPFSISGAFVALWITGQTLNIFSMIGLILLMGIVKKNSILLVEFTNHVREEKPGVPVNEALLEACPIRLRPILMTSFATIAGAIPPALAIGPGAETRVPMAVAVIGGVIVSTFLTLLAVPCVYSLFAALDRRKRAASSSITSHANGFEPLTGSSL